MSSKVTTKKQKTEMAPAKDAVAVERIQLGVRMEKSMVKVLKAMAELSCPVLFVLGAQDQMTPPKAAQSLIKAAYERGVRHEVVTVPMGHHQMNESPEETLAAIKGFLWKYAK